MWRLVWGSPHASQGRQKPGAHPPFKRPFKAEPEILSLKYFVPLLLKRPLRKGAAQAWMLPLARSAQSIIISVGFGDGLHTALAVSSATVNAAAAHRSRPSSLVTLHVQWPPLPPLAPQPALLSPAAASSSLAPPPVQQPPRLLLGGSAPSSLEI